MNTKNLIVVFFTFFAVTLTEAQSYRWRTSDNCLQNEGNPDFKYCYKIETESGFFPSAVIYEMTDTSHFDNRLNIENRTLFPDMDILFFIINIDGKKDSVVFVDSTNIVEIKFQKKPVIIEVKGVMQNNTIVLPITPNMLPQKMTIIWGMKDVREFLTIFSKRTIEYKELMWIKEQICSGQAISNDEYYYYLGDQ